MLHLALWLALALASCQSRWVHEELKPWVQKPTIHSCSDEQQATIRNLTIENAILGEKIEVTSTIHISKTLGLNAEVEITFKLENGSNPDCPDDIYCSYFQQIGFIIQRPLCGEILTDGDENNYEDARNVQCPILPTTLTETSTLELPAELSVFFGRSSVARLLVEIKLTDGGSTIACQSFVVSVRKI